MLFPRDIRESQGIGTLKKVEQADEKQQCWYIYSNDKVHIKGNKTPAI